MNKSPQVLEIRDLSHTFFGEGDKKVEALKNASFSVRKGEFFVLLGPSGCGKSTLLRIIAGMIRPHHGEVVFSDETVQKNVAMIFQSFALFPWLTVHENVEFGLKMRGTEEKARERLVIEHIKEMELENFSDMYPRDLSGGMKQRVGIARALAVSPQILLMDEPFSALDAFTAKRLRQEVLALWLKDQMTNIMVTHLVEEAVEVADRVAVMTPLPGKVETIVPIDMPRPRNTRSPEFFRMVDALTAMVKV